MRYRVASATLAAEHAIGEAHALCPNDRTLCGLTAPPLRIAWREGHWPPRLPSTARCAECARLVELDPDTAP